MDFAGDDRRPGAYIGRDPSGRYTVHVRQRVMASFATRRPAKAALRRLRHGYAMV